MMKLGVPRMIVAIRMPLRSVTPPRRAQPTTTPSPAPIKAPSNSPGTAIHSVLAIRGSSTSQTDCR